MFIRNFTKGPTWLPGTVLQKQGPRTFTIKLMNGRIWRRHVNHIRYRSVDITATTELEDFDDCIPMTAFDFKTPVSKNSSTSQVVPRRSTRPRHPPDRLVYKS